MANRLLTAEQIAALCATVSPEFRVVYDADSISLPIIMLRSQSIPLVTLDLLLSDEDFMNRFPRQMLARATRPIWEGTNIPVAAALLDQRGATHGDYRAMSTRIQQIKVIMRMGSKWVDMSEPQKEALELIATKIGRIIEGDPNHHDHWEDIKGYSQLVLDRIGHKHA